MKALLYLWITATFLAADFGSTQTPTDSPELYFISITGNELRHSEDLPDYQRALEAEGMNYSNFEHVDMQFSPEGPARSNADALSRLRKSFQNTKEKMKESVGNNVVIMLRAHGDDQGEFTCSAKDDEELSYLTYQNIYDLIGEFLPRQKVVFFAGPCHAGSAIDSTKKIPANTIVITASEKDRNSWSFYYEDNTKKLLNFVNFFRATKNCPSEADTDQSQKVEIDEAFEFMAKKDREMGRYRSNPQIYGNKVRLSESINSLDDLTLEFKKMLSGVWTLISADASKATSSPNERTSFFLTFPDAMFDPKGKTIACMTNGDRYECTTQVDGRNKTMTITGYPSFEPRALNCRIDSITDSELRLITEDNVEYLYRKATNAEIKRMPTGRTYRQSTELPKAKTAK